MELRKIEVTEEELKLGTETYYKGDIKSFPKPEADRYIDLGWCKCCETGEQGDRKPGAVSLDIQNIETAVS